VRRALVALVVAIGVLAGCGGVPDGGEPVAVPNRKLERGFPAVNADLVGPRAGDGPLDVIELFLDAARSTQSRDRIGEKFLTARAEDAWKRPPGEVRLFKPGTMTVTSETESTAVVRIPGTITGVVNDVGVHRTTSQRVTYTVNLLNQGGWRIDGGLPP
jgi:hypothetical protein